MDQQPAIFLPLSCGSMRGFSFIPNDVKVPVASYFKAFYSSVTMSYFRVKTSALAMAEIDLDNLKGQIQMFDYVWFTVSDLHGIPRAKLIPSRHVADVIDRGLGVYSGRLLIYKRYYYLYKHPYYYVADLLFSWILDHSSGSVLYFAPLSIYISNQTPKKLLSCT